MKQISTGIFISFFLIAYIGVLWVLSASVVYILPKELLEAALRSEYITTFSAIIISGLSYLLTSFCLRSYYQLPKPPLKIATSIIILQVILAVIPFLLGKDLNLIDIRYLLLTLATMGITGIFVWGSLELADRYFKKRYNS